MKLLTPGALILLLLAAVPAAAQKMTKESIDYLGTPRSYYLFIPKSVRESSKPAPLLFLLHGATRDGSSLVEKWTGLAKDEGIVLVGPDAQSRAMWQTLRDDPGLFQQIAEAVRAQVPVDTRRIYLFGHSAGGCYALLLSLLESEYFAAAAIHAGALGENEQFFEKSKRKIPVHIQVGTRDDNFPLPLVRATREAFSKRGFPVELLEIKGHTHWYYDRAPKINRTAWDFLKRYSLPGEPRYEDHGYGRYLTPPKGGS